MPNGATVSCDDRAEASKFPLFVQLVDELNDNIGASLHRFIVGAFDVDLPLTVLEAEMGSL
ncbi:hypothetical protein [Agrobacterium tumefaciens]|uniref:hypothetical protein n=1 Tax=Agrobacterium tumefaciens TaxID=358 RepID=UPI00287F5904|nr:hypothetical protein [Agrobacterium tumefaciens]